MRAILAILGVLLSTPALLFFWIGTQTFVRGDERLLANILTLATGALLTISIVLIFNPAVQRVQAILMAITIALLVFAFSLVKIRG